MAKTYTKQDLKNANFRNYNLAGVNFCGANLEGADFSGANLRGANFTSAVNQPTNIKNANFSGADIRGANFLKANLEKSNLSNVQAGSLPYTWTLLILMSCLRVGLVFIQLEYLIILSELATFMLLTYFAYKRGFYKQGSLTISANIFCISGIIAYFIEIILAYILKTIFHVNTIYFIYSWGSIPILIAFISYIVLLLIGSNAGVIGGALQKRNARFIHFLFKIPLEIVGITFISISGTNFKWCNLSGVNFAGATLKDSDFYRAKFYHSCFINLKCMVRCRLTDTDIIDDLIRSLLITGQGKQKDLSGRNLSGFYLIGANLQNSNLKGANLNNTLLKNANLHNANLSRVQAIGADFSSANLTGACLEAWNIDSNTILSDVGCDYVFLLEHPNEKGDRERRPHDPNQTFRSGDFEKYFKQVLEDMQLLIRDGINPEAFRAAFQTLMQNHGIIPSDIRSMQKQGNDVMLTVQVSPNVDKGQAEQDFHSTYNLRLEAAKATALLEAERQHKQEVMDLADRMTHNFGNLLSNLSISNSMLGNSVMSDSNNPQISVTAGGSIGAVAGGDVSIEGVINLGAISGNLSNSIDQLQTADTPEAPTLSSLLEKLQTAIVNNSDELDDKAKAKALKYLEALAAAGTTPQDDTLQEKAETAIDALTGILGKTTNLVTTAGPLLEKVLALGLFV